MMTEESSKYAVVQYEEDVYKLGSTLVKSGYFADAKDAAQAVVKVLAGREFGIGPIASMTGIHIIKGRPAIGANLMAAAVKRSGHYNFRVRKLTDEECSIEFFEREGDKWTPLGVSTFTIQDARKAQTQNIDKFPRNMLYARAMSNGVKWYTPDVTVAPVYSPDELGAHVDWETGEVIESTATPAPPTGQPTGQTPTPAPAATPSGNGYSREKLVNRLYELAKESAALGQPVDLDLTWLTEAADSELIDYGKRLAKNINELKAQPE
jgi:hypothetical protein